MLDEAGSDHSALMEDDDPGLISEEVLRTLPKNQQKIIRSLSTTMFHGTMPLQNPVLNKITEEHIAAVLKNADKEDERDRQERKDERSHNYKIMTTALVFMLVVGSLLVYSQQTEVLKYVIGAIFGFAGASELESFIADMTDR